MYRDHGIHEIDRKNITETVAKCSGAVCDESVGYLCDKHAAERSAYKGTNVLELAEIIGDVFRDNGHAEAVIIAADLLLKWRREQ